jgi:hypothetical protein
MEPGRASDTASASPSSWCTHPGHHRGLLASRDRAGVSLAGAMGPAICHDLGTTESGRRYRNGRPPDGRSSSAVHALCFNRATRVYPQSRAATTAGVTPRPTYLTTRAAADSSSSPRDTTSWDEVVTKLGHEHLRRHDLRHTGLTWMADAAIPIHHLRKIVATGHSPQHSDTYTPTVTRFRTQPYCSRNTSQRPQMVPKPARSRSAPDRRMG